jgi:hypothetical protein
MTPTERFMQQHYGASGFVKKSEPTREVYNAPDTPESMAQWIWHNYVGIPLTEPYDAEYTRLLERVRRLHRQSFVAGLNECARQMHKLPLCPTCGSDSPQKRGCAGGLRAECPHGHDDCMDEFHNPKALTGQA